MGTGRSEAFSVGRKTVNRVPMTFPEVTAMRSLWRRTMPATKERPRPRPSSFEVQKGLKGGGPLIKLRLC